MYFVFEMHFENACNLHVEFFIFEKNLLYEHDKIQLIIS